MKYRKKASDAPPRERRVFPDEFKREAVRLLPERRAAWASVTRIGRGINLRPDQLRERERRMADREGDRNFTCTRAVLRPDPICRSDYRSGGNAGVSRSRSSLSGTALLAITAYCFHVRAENRLPPDAAITSACSRAHSPSAFTRSPAREYADPIQSEP